MTKRFSIVALAICLGLVGCQSEKSAEANSATDTPEATSSNAPTEGTGTSLSLDKLPAELKNDAYEYYGLGRTEPLKMQIKQDGSAPSVGAQTVKLTKVEGGKAVFTIEHNDGLSQLGEMTVVLEKDGVRSAKNAQIEPDPSAWELPAGLSAGKTWETKTLPTSSLKLSGTNKIEGTKSLTTAVGTYKDAMLVTFSGTGEQGTEKFKLTTKMWMVKGRGTVKSELERSAHGKTIKIVLEEVK